MVKIGFAKNNYTVDGLYQWDKHQTLVIEGLSLSMTPEIHFAHDGSQMAIIREAEMDDSGVIRVEVPSYLLEKSYRINAYVCLREGEEFQTLCRIAIPVQSRAVPSDYEPVDETVVFSIDAFDVEAVTLEAGQSATVEKVQRGDTWVLRFGLPVGKGDPGERGPSAVVASDTEPTDPEVMVWVDPTGTADNWPGKLLYIDASGTVMPLTLGAGLQIVDGVLSVTGVPDTPDEPDEPEIIVTAICGQALCGQIICGGAA